MRNPEVLIGIFATIFLFGGPIAVFIVHRVLKHQERMAMIAHGMIPGEMPKTAAGRSAWSGPQAAPPPGTQPYVSYQEFAAAQNQLRKGLTTALIGFAILIGLFFIDVSRPGPWLLGGLIPMFVGIAQVIVAILSGARLAPPGGPYQQMPGAPPPPSGMNQPRDPSPPGNSYAYRPGSTVELEPPASPPDRR